MPYLKLLIQADEDSPTKRASASLSWYANAWTHDSSLQVENFKYEMFHEWFARTHDDIRNLPAVVDADGAKRRDELIYVECDLQKPVFSNFKDQSVWETVPKAVSRAFHALLTGMQRVSFLVFPKRNDLRKYLLPALSRHITEGVGMLSQYMDPKTQEYSLYGIEDVASVRQVRGGMYLTGDDTTILELPKVYNFPFPLQFKVFAALPPIREAQYEASNKELNIYQAELTAVNHFCHNAVSHPPNTNLHHLLMTSGQSNCNEMAILDLCGTAHHSIELFEVAVEAARTMLNEKQVYFIERLRDIRSNTLALTVSGFLSSLALVPLDS